MSCDHHGLEGTVPSNRSRARMLEQLRKAELFADAFLELTRGSALKLDFTSGDTPQIRPTITLDLEQYLWAWQAFMTWHIDRPDGDDWEPAVDPPSTTRVPPDDDEVIPPP